jgi:isopentenyl-diphosphate delta-isomerase
VRRASRDLPLFASGGLHDGIDVAKCLALGADLGGLAGTFLKAANDSLETTVETMRMVRDQIRIAMFSAGAKTLQDLTPDMLTTIP